MWQSQKNRIDVSTWEIYEKFTVKRPSLVVINH